MSNNEDDWDDVIEPFNAEDALAEMKKFLGSSEGARMKEAMRVSTAPRPVMRTMMYSFPLATLDPGVEQKVSVPVRGTFRAQKLIVTAEMDEIRGYYVLKRTRLPFLDRDDVTAYTTLRRNRRGERVWFTPRKVIIEFSGFYGGYRSYNAKSVVYIHTDASEYVMLKQMMCGTEPTMPAIGEGASALYFGPNALGNGIPAPSTDISVSLVLKNIGDVLVRVRSTVMGPGLDEPR